MPAKGETRLAIYDIKGRKVKYSVGVYINGGLGGRKFENCIVIDSLDVEEENIPQPENKLP